MKSKPSKSCLIIMRLPFIERVPNALHLVGFLVEKGFTIKLLSTTDPMYPLPDRMSPSISYDSIPSREQGAKIPTSIRLLTRALSLVRSLRPSFIVGVDCYGNLVASVVKKLTGVSYVNFVLEYPQPRKQRRGLTERLEAAALRSANIVITHDRHHKDFLIRETGVLQDRIWLLPNGSGPRECLPRTRYLGDKLGLAKDDKVILHSGGFGPWFCCHELAEAAAQWEDSKKLVFHTSHHVESTDYAKEFRSLGLDKQAILHSSPVPDAQLDELVGSATIGLAIYSLDLLGFRAEYLGLAAGKIGRYLKNGIPVIATNVFSIREYVESYKCGICVDTLDQIETAISDILADYRDYSRNALRCYDDLWDLQEHCDGLVSHLQSLTSCI